MTWQFRLFGADRRKRRYRSVRCCFSLATSPVASPTSMLDISDVMTVHSPRFSVLVAGFSGVVLFMAGAIWVSSSVLQINAARAESEKQNPIEHARKALESLIDRLRGRDCPRGYLKPTAVSKRRKLMSRQNIPVAQNSDSGRGRRGHGWTGRRHHIVTRNRGPAAPIPGAVVESETGDGISCLSHRSS